MSQTDEQKNCLFPLKNRVTAFMVLYVTKDKNMKLPNPHLNPLHQHNQHKGKPIKINRQKWAVHYFFCQGSTHDLWKRLGIAC